MKHVGDALGDTLIQSRNNIVTIGIAPWGVVHNSADLLGKNVRSLDTTRTHVPAFRGCALSRIFVDWLLESIAVGDPVPRHRIAEKQQHCIE